MPYPPIELDRAVVVITGAARGIGRQTAERFVERGAQVAVCDLDADLAADAAATLGEAATPFSVDVASSESFAACVEAVRGSLGPIDVLVNNAGIAPVGRFADEPEEVSDAVLDVNVRGVMTGMRLVLPDMLERRRGHIVNVASLIARGHAPGVASYTASKWAVVGLSRAVRSELEGTGVTLTAVLPSVVNTELASGIPLPAVLTPLVRVEPDAIAQAIVASVRDRRAQIAVPRWLDALMNLQPFIPPFLETAVRRLVRDDRALTSLDFKDRAAYDERLARQTGSVRASEEAGSRE